MKSPVLSSVILLLALAACGAPSEPNEKTPEPDEVELPFIDLSSRSAENYADNESGIVTGSRLETWQQGWATAKPEAVKGDLIVLQFDEAEFAETFVAPAEGVRVHQAAELTRLMETRSNGVASIGTVPADGIRIDSFMRRMNIRPNHDFVLLAATDLNPRSLAILARAYLFFRYWGFEHTALGILNEPVSALAESQRSPTVEPHPFSGVERIDVATSDNFDLLADIGAVRKAVGRGAIIDARSAAEYEGRELGKSVFDATCLKGVPYCSPTFSGRITGAKHLPASSVITSEARFRSLAEIESALQQTGIGSDEVAYVYDLDGYDGALVTVSLLAVAGQPARWYAASYLEWGAYNASHPEEALRPLSPESPWRNDVFPALTEGERVWAEKDSGVRPLVLDENRASTDRVQKNDREYKRTLPALPAVGAGEGGC